MGDLVVVVLHQNAVMVAMVITWSYIRGFFTPSKKSHK